MVTVRKTETASNPNVTARSPCHAKKSAMTSEIRSSVQTAAKKAKNHLLYRNFRIQLKSRTTR